MIMDRELKPLKLPSGKKAKIVTFFTRGEVKAIEQKKWEGATVKQAEDGRVIIDNIPVTQKLVEDDYVVMTGLKVLVEGDKEVTQITQAIIDSMAVDDFKLLLDELTAVISKKK